MSNSYGFKSSARLKRPQDFNAVFAQPRCLRSKYFTILVSPNECKNARLGITIAKRRVRLSVHRNRLKRIVRESFRHAFSILQNIDIVVICKEALNIPNEILYQCLEKHWKNLQNI